MKTQFSIFSILLLAGLSIPTAARAQSNDMTFAKQAASGGIAEVKMGQLAQKNGSSEAVKDFGKRMETDHSKANKHLKEIASKDNITLPTTMNKTEQATYNRLSQLNAAAFDKAYTTDMVKDHQKDVSDFRKEANSGSNPDIKQFASETLPTLEEHLKLAKDAEKTTSASR